MAITNIDEEAAEVEVLQSRLAKTIELTSKISLSLSKLSASATNVEQAVKPIYGKTQSLTSLAENVEKAIAAVEKIRKPADTVSREEPTIRKGPQRTGLTEYLASLKRTNDNLQTLKTTNLRSQQTAITQMTTLLKTGALELENLFRQALAEDSNPVEPLSFVLKGLPFPLFTSQKINMLAVLNDFLSSTLAQASGLQSNAIQIYIELRSQYIVATLSSLAQATLNTASRRGAASLYDKGSNGIVMYTKALESIFLSEYENISQLFAPSSWSKVYSQTTAPAMQAFASTVRDLDKFVRQNMMSDCYLAYDVIETVTPTASKLGAKTGDKEGFAEALKPIRQTAQGSFSDILEDVKRKAATIVTLPNDNGVCELTTDVMSRLRRLVDYKLAITGLLIGLGDGNWRTPGGSRTAALPSLQQFDVGADGNLLLSKFCVDVIDALLSQLDGKARTLLKKSGAAAVLMINNTFYVESQIQRSELGAIMSPSTMKTIEMKRKRAVGDYMESWKECATYLMDTTYTGKVGAKITAKERDNVKEKFKNFNTAFDECVQRHKSFTFSDPEVRGVLLKEISFIIPLYGRFFDKYKDSMRDKYVKYDREQLEAILRGL